MEEWTTNVLWVWLKSCWKNLICLAWWLDGINCSLRRHWWIPPSLPWPVGLPNHLWRVHLGLPASDHSKLLTFQPNFTFQDNYQNQIFHDQEHCWRQTINLCFACSSFSVLCPNCCLKHGFIWQNKAVIQMTVRRLASESHWCFQQIEKEEPPSSHTHQIEQTGNSHSEKLYVTRFCTDHKRGYFPGV